jgi:uncharacterized protein
VTLTRLWLGGGVALLLACFAAFAQVAVPQLRSPVTDLTQTLTAEQANALELRLREFEKRKGSQIAILLVPTTQPETIEEYAIRVAEAWQLGRRGVDDGVLLLVAKDDRAVRIEVGYGLEGALTDVIANRITDQVIVPHFRQGDFFGGLSAALDRIIAVIEGEPLPEPARREARSAQGLMSLLPLLFMFAIIAGGVLRSVFGTFGGAAVSGRRRRARLVVHAGAAHGHRGSASHVPVRLVRRRRRSRPQLVESRRLGQRLGRGLRRRQLGRRRLRRRRLERRWRRLRRGRRVRALVVACPSSVCGVI